MAQPLKAATIYYLSYENEESMLFINGWGSQQSTTNTNWGFRVMCNNTFALDLSGNTTPVNIFANHPSGSRLIFIAELEEWVGNTATKLRNDMDSEVARICRDMPLVASSAEWTKWILFKLVEKGVLEFSLNALNAKEGTARTNYTGPGSEVFRTAAQLQ